MIFSVHDCYFLMRQIIFSTIRFLKNYVILVPCPMYLRRANKMSEAFYLSFDKLSSNSRISTCGNDSRANISGCSRSLSFETNEGQSIASVRDGEETKSNEDCLHSDHLEQMFPKLGVNQKRSDMRLLTRESGEGTVCLASIRLA